MVELLVVDVCAVLMAEESHVRLFISQAEKDNLLIYCYGQMSRRNLRTALRTREYLDLFDGLLHEDILSVMTSEELRRLDDKSRVMWFRTPAEINYTSVLDRLPKRKRALPKALRLLGQPPLADDLNFHSETE